jgi:hypothetical protein
MSNRKITAHKGAHIKVTFEGVLRDNLPENWDNLHVDTDHGSVYMEYGHPESVQIEVLSDLLVPRRIYRDQGGREGFTLMDAEDDLYIHWLTGESEEVSELDDSLLPLVQIYPPVG